MKMRLVLAVLALALIPFTGFLSAEDKPTSKQKAEEENPYKKVKVGEYADYKMTMKVGPLNLEGTITQLVKAKTDKEATLEVTGKMNGMDIPAQSQKIDLTKPYDPTKASGLPTGADAKIELLKSGDEKIKVGGKEYACKWETYKAKVKMMGQEIEMDMKVWQSKEFSLNMIKMEMTADVGGNKMEMTMELSGSGEKKAD